VTTARCMRMLTAVAAALALALAGCGSSDDEKSSTSAGTQTTSGEKGRALPVAKERVALDPAEFTTRIDNPYWPMPVGRRWVSRSSEERIVVTVTGETRVIEGVSARVVRDVVTTPDGDLIENTHDWYAQDAAGNVWYLGEDTKEYENGRVSSTEGSWEAGVDGAQAGIIMPAKPSVGLKYRQEYYAGKAEDRARVLRVDAQVKVPFGSFDTCVETEDFTPLEPGNVEHKFYARDVGPVLRTTESGGGREELVAFRR
jgi:hypothetical protein